MTCSRPAVAVTFGGAGNAVKLVNRHECTARTKKPNNGLTARCQRLGVGGVSGFSAIGRLAVLVFYLAGIANGRTVQKPRIHTQTYFEVADHKPSKKFPLHLKI